MSVLSCCPQCKSEDPSTLVNALEAIQPGLSHQVLSFIVLPAVLASPTSPLHVKKVLILGLARMATCPAVMSGNKQLLSSTLEALSMLISKKEEDERSEDQAGQDRASSPPPLLYGLLACVRLLGMVEKERKNARTAELA